MQEFEWSVCQDNCVGSITSAYHWGGCDFSRNNLLEM